jgi:hypothetical protein
MTDTKYTAAVKKLQALGYQWGGDEWSMPNQQYGCHCDLEPGMEPDGCVLDYGNANDCVHARGLVASGKGRADCHEWRPIELKTFKAAIGVTPNK